MPGIVHQPVDRQALALGFGVDALRSIGMRKIQRDGVAAHRIFLADLVGECGEPIGAARYQHLVHPLGRELPSELRADPARGARGQCDSLRHDVLPGFHLRFTVRKVLQYWRIAP
jgi:hypothetical protein